MERTNYLAIRFDIDSVTCCERGVPRLLELGRRRGVKFTFFANMGRSFNFMVNCRLRLKGRPTSGPPQVKLGLKEKLTWSGILKTVILNPALGTKYLKTLERVKKEGHELGLHGGTDHVVWQHGIRDMNRDSLLKLFLPAYEQFSQAFGKPEGFACPGFQYDDRVFDILENYNFAYSSDMDGEHPFPTTVNGKRHRLWQVPVNIMGGGKVPAIEEMIAKGCDAERIGRDVADRIMRKEFSLLYGHPYVEGVRCEILDSVLDRIQNSHQVVTLSEYLEKWRKIYDS